MLEGIPMNIIYRPTKQSSCIKNVTIEDNCIYSLQKYLTLKKRQKHCKKKNPQYKIVKSQKEIS